MSERFFFLEWAKTVSPQRGKKFHAPSEKLNIAIYTSEFLLLLEECPRVATGVTYNTNYLCKYLLTRVTQYMFPNSGEYLIDELHAVAGWKGGASDQRIRAGALTMLHV
jgi:hypothetical protein